MQISQPIRRYVMELVMTSFVFADLSHLIEESKILTFPLLGSRCRMVRGSDLEPKYCGFDS